MPGLFRALSAHGLCSAVAICAAMFAPASARAQWSVTTLSPGVPGESSQASSGSGGVVGGSVTFRGLPNAAVWDISRGAWQNLQAPIGSLSQVRGVWGNQFVGFVGSSASPFNSSASLWRGTLWEGLHPLGASESSAWAIWGAQQVGWATIGGVTQAGLWSGSAASWVSLHPSGSTGSSALGVFNGQQVGSATINGVTRAGLWNGTASSWVSLHPVGATSSSASGVAEGVQVGSADIGGVTRASLWRGSASSWVDLSPAGASFSFAFAAGAGVQVGSAQIGETLRASIWNGTAASWEDLSLALPGSWSSSEARAVWTDGVTLYVAGSGRNDATGFVEGLLWTRPIPAPGAAGLLALAGVCAARRRR